MYKKGLLAERAALASILCRGLPSPLPFVSFFVLAAYSFVGLKSVVLSLLFCSWASNLSAAICPDVGMDSLGRILVLLAAFVAVTRLGKSAVLDRCMLLVMVINFMACTAVVHSVLFSQIPDVSILKVVLWWLGAFSIARALGRMSQNDLVSTRDLAYQSLKAVVLLSLATSWSAMAYLTNGTGLQGVLRHPQTFGVVSGLGLTWSVMTFLTNASPKAKDLLFIGGVFVACFLSESRSALLSSFFALGLAFFLGVVFRLEPLKRMCPGLLSPLGLAVVLSIISVVVLQPGDVVSRSEAFLSKGTDAQSLAEAYTRSRGGLLDVMYENIDRNPMFGIGFGLGSFPELMQVTRDPIFGLPLSAPVEKGVLYVAILEELGIPLGLVFNFLLLCAAYAATRISITNGAVVLFILLSGAGEAALFSIGGFGLLLCVILGLALTVNLNGNSR